MAVKGGQLHGKETQSPQRDTDGLQKGTVTFLRCQDNCTGDRRRTVKKRMTEGAAVFLPPIPGGGGTRMSPPRCFDVFLRSDLQPLLEDLKDHLSNWRSD